MGERKSVLIVVSSYEPAMPASMHRARMLAWAMEEVGWDVEILTPSRAFQQDVWFDPAAARFFKNGIPRHEAEPMLLDPLMRFLGMNSAAWRGLLPMYFAGSRLLSVRRYSVIFFSTTTFTFFCLGRLWLWRYRQPYVLDFQDPWFIPSPALVSVKRRLKSWLSNKLAKYMESFAVRGASGIVSVSPGYLKTLIRRYGSITPLLERNAAVIPFGALELDLKGRMAADSSISGPSNLRLLAYVGVGNVIMQRSFRRIVRGLAALRRDRPELIESVRLLLYGTQGGWRTGERKVLWEEAKLAGLGDLVIEEPAIVSYSTAISYAMSADGLLVLGVDDPDYMPSKLFTYAFTGKPLLVCLHRESQGNDYFFSFPELGTLIHFDDGDESNEEVEDAKLAEFLADLKSKKRFMRNEVKHRFSALAMATQHAAHFERCLANTP